MNQSYSYSRLVGVYIFHCIRSALTTCGIIRSHVKKDSRSPQHKLWNNRALVWSAVAAAGPDVQLAVQFLLAFLSSMGGMALAYACRASPRLQMHNGDETRNDAASLIVSCE